MELFPKNAAIFPNCDTRGALKETAYIRNPKTITMSNINVPKLKNDMRGANGVFMLTLKIKAFLFPFSMNYSRGFAATPRL